MPKTSNLAETSRTTAQHEETSWGISTQLSPLLVFTPSSYLRRTFVCRESNFAQVNSNNAQQQATTRHLSKIYDDCPAKCSSYLRRTWVIPSSYFVILRHTPPIALPDLEAGASFGPRNRKWQNTIISLKTSGSAGCHEPWGRGRG